MKQNCWEFFQCGREPGGARVADLGECPAATMTEADGVHDGVNGGRCCWALAGTLCKGEVQGTFASKLATCFDCEFYRRVHREEIESIRPSAILERIKK